MTALNIRDYDPETKISEPGIYRMSLSEYHSDCCDAPSFSSGDLVQISKSGEEYWDQSYYNTDAAERKHKPHLALGSAAHAKILDPKHWQADYILRPKAFRSWRGEEAQNWRMVQERGGKIAITEDEVKIVDGMARKILNDPTASAIFADGEPELSLFARFEDIWLKCRPDMTPYFDLSMELDYKTAEEVDTLSVERAIERWNYDQKLANIAWIKRQLPEDFPELPDVTQCAYALVFQKTKRPFGVTSVDVSPHYIIQLASKNIAAAQTAAAVMRGEMSWPGFTDGIHKYEPKPWNSRKLEHMIGSGELPKLNENMEIVG